MLKQFFAAFALCAAMMPAARATSVIPLYLEEIVDQSAVAFEGTVTENRNARDEEGRPVTYTTFAVSDALKGNPGSTYTIKQLGAETEGGLNYRAYGIPKFSVGQHVVVFLYGKSSAGFSSPVGLAQGRFAVGTDETGESVSNGRDFRDMARNLVSASVLDAQARSTTAPVRKMNLAQFKDLVRNHAKARAMATEGAQ